MKLRPGAGCIGIDRHALTRAGRVGERVGIVMAWSCIAKDRARSAGRTGLRNTAAEESISLRRIAQVDASHYNAATGCTCCCCRRRWSWRPSSSSASISDFQTVCQRGGTAREGRSRTSGACLHAARFIKAIVGRCAIEDVEEA